MYLPQSAWSRMQRHTVPRTASNTLTITGMPGEVRAHGVPCHFPSCPIPGFAPVGHASQERSARMKVLLQQLSGEHDGRDVPFLLSLGGHSKEAGDTGD